MHQCLIHSFGVVPPRNATETFTRRSSDVFVLPEDVPYHVPGSR